MRNEPGSWEITTKRRELPALSKKSPGLYIVLKKRVMGIKLYHTEPNTHYSILNTISVF
jgi:hypothetical protein